MRQTLQTLLAMWKKNNTQPGVWATVWVLGAMTAFAIVDARRSLPPTAWLAMALWVLILGTSAGAGAFSSDLKLNHMRFLEYLPIRRWHIWVADWGDGILWLLLIVLAVALPRTIVWSPPDPNIDSPVAMLDQIFFPTRLALLTGLGCLAFAAFSIGAFYRILVERDSAAIFRAIMSSMAVCSMVWAVPVMLRIFPTLLEAAVPLFAVGVVFSAGSFVLFVADRRHWHWLRRWAVLRLPCWVVVHLLVVGMMYVTCRRWAAFDPAAPARVYVDASSVGAGGDLLVNVHSVRSGQHLFRVNAETGRRKYLGRGLTPYSRGLRGRSLAGDRLVASASFGPDGLWPAHEAIVTLRPDGTDRRPLFKVLREYVDTDGKKYMPAEVGWSEDGTAFFFGARSYAGNDAVLFVTDANAAVRQRVPIDPGAMQFLVRGGELFVPAPTGRNPMTEDRQPPRGLLRIDLHSDQRRTIELPGVLVGCSGDLSGAVCLKTREADGVQHRSLLWVDLDTLAQTVIAGEDELPTIPLDDVRTYHTTSLDSSGIADRRRLEEPGGDIYFDDVHVSLDATSPKRAAWFVLVKDQHLAAPGVTLVDLAGGGPKRVLVSDAAAVRPRPATRPADRDVRPFTVHGFSPAGDALIYEWQGVMLAVPTDPAAGDSAAPPRVMARRPDGFDHATFELSPDRRRVIAAAYRYDRDAPTPRNAHATQVWDSGRPVTIAEGDGRMMVGWLDDRRLLLQDGATVTIADADGTNRRVIFESGSKNDDAAGSAPK